MIDFDKVPISKWGYVDWRKIYNKLMKHELVSHGYEVRPEIFSDVRRSFPELYLVMSKEEADRKLLAYASLLTEWRDQLTYIRVDDPYEFSMNDPRKWELYDPDEESEMPSLSDLINLTQSTFNEICIPIRNTLEIRRLEKKINYWKTKINETEQLISELTTNTQHGSISAGT